MIIDSSLIYPSLFYTGILGLFIFYAVLIYLSARMGEGMGIPKYYTLYYLAILALITAIPAGWSVHYAKEMNLQDTLFALLTAGNTIALAASFKYWWWLKDEFWVNKNKEVRWEKK